MLITCKCLNVTLEVKDVEIRNPIRECFKFPYMEEIENYFKEDIKEIQIVSAKKQVASLVQQRSVGAWSVEYCMNCSVDCYAVHLRTERTVINATLIATKDAIKHMKNNRDFSPVFRIIIQPLADDAFRATSVADASGKIRNILTSLQQQMRDSIRGEVAKTEDSIRKFSEEQYMKLEDFQNRATKDHKALAHKIFEVQLPFPEPEPEFPNISTESRRFSSHHGSSNRRTSESRNAASVSSSGSQNSGYKARANLLRPINPYPSEADKIPGSLDSEGLFVLDGMEDAMANEPFYSEEESDSDHEGHLSDTPDSGSHDEGIDVHRARSPCGQMAKSLPVDVPVQPPPISETEKELTNGLDIAESIKALARSVHGDTVFGDLPRPRFSTQI